MDLPRTNSQSPAWFPARAGCQLCTGRKGVSVRGHSWKIYQTTQSWSGETAIMHSSVRREEHRMELHWGLCGTNHCLRC